MKHLITIILITITTAIFGQTLPELVEKDFNSEMNGTANKYSKVDFNNIDQGLINKLVAKKIRTKQILNNPLTLFTGGKQVVDTSAVKAAKHHTLYQVNKGRLTHTESGDFKTFSHRYKYYSGGEFGSIISNGEIVCSFKVDGNISYNKLVNKIIKQFMGSKPHREIILMNNDKNDLIGSFVAINKKGFVYNTIIFP